MFTIFHIIHIIRVLLQVSTCMATRDNASNMPNAWIPISGDIVYAKYGIHENTNWRPNSFSPQIHSQNALKVVPTDNANERDESKQFTNTYTGIGQGDVINERNKTNVKYNSRFPKALEAESAAANALQNARHQLATNTDDSLSAYEVREHDLERNYALSRLITNHKVYRKLDKHYVKQLWSLFLARYGIYFYNESKFND